MPVVVRRSRSLVDKGAGDASSRLRGHFFLGIEGVALGVADRTPARSSRRLRRGDARAPGYRRAPSLHRTRAQRNKACGSGTASGARSAVLLRAHACTLVVLPLVLEGRSTRASRNCSSRCAILPNTLGSPVRQRAAGHALPRRHAVLGLALPASRCSESALAALKNKIAQVGKSPQRRLLLAELAIQQAFAPATACAGGIDSEAAALRAARQHRRAKVRLLVVRSCELLRVVRSNRQSSFRARPPTDLVNGLDVRSHQARPWCAVRSAARSTELAGRSAGATNGCSADDGCRCCALTSLKSPWRKSLASLIRLFDQADENASRYPESRRGEGTQEAR